MFLRKGVLKICSKVTGEHPCPSAISLKFQSNFIEIVLWYGCSPVNLVHIFRTPFPRKTSGWLFLEFICIVESGRLNDVINYIELILLVHLTIDKTRLKIIAMLN